MFGPFGINEQHPPIKQLKLQFHMLLDPRLLKQCTQLLPDIYIVLQPKLRLLTLQENVLILVFEDDRDKVVEFWEG
jgi:hypothetical protein